MLGTISNLPNCHQVFTMKNYCIYAVDDYSLHIMPKVKKALLKRGYVYVEIGGRVNGDTQTNDTDIYVPLKREYRKIEQELMINQLQYDPKKMPKSTRDDMMQILVESLQNINVDIPERHEALCLISLSMEVKNT